MMIRCATARWKLPTKASAYADRQWLFLIRIFPLILVDTAAITVTNDQFFAGTQSMFMLLEPVIGTLYTSL